MKAQEKKILKQTTLYIDLYPTIILICALDYVQKAVGDSISIGVKLYYDYYLLYPSPSSLILGKVKQQQQQQQTEGKNHGDNRSAYNIIIGISFI